MRGREGERERERGREGVVEVCVNLYNVMIIAPTLQRLGEGERERSEGGRR